MSESKKKAKTLKGMVRIEITNPELLTTRLNGGGKVHSSYNKGDQAVYHASTAQRLVDMGVAKVIEEIEEYFHPAMKR